jgi:hypothetical protein
LVVMHALVALITYNLLVLVAPAGTVDAADTTNVRAEWLAEARGGGANGASTTVPRGVWVLLMSADGVEFLVGLVGMVFVPFSRPNGWLPRRGEAIYLAHALLGGVLGLTVLAVFFFVVRQPSRDRVEFVGALSGLSGVLVGALGGALCYSHALRLLGMAIMFVGVSVAFFGFLIPLLDRGPRATDAEAS